MCPGKDGRRPITQNQKNVKKHNKRSSTRRGKNQGTLTNQKNLFQAWGITNPQLSKQQHGQESNNQQDQQEVPASYGKLQGTKRPNLGNSTIWVQTQNIHGVSIDRRSPKSKQCIAYLLSQQPTTVSLWQEIQVYWPKTHLDSRWAAWTKKPNFSTTFGYNIKEEQSSPTQPGGTAVTTARAITPRVIAKDSDSLGQWSWVLVGIKGTQITTFISAYQPCKSGDAGSSFQQQRRFFNDPTKDPREIFLKDLEELVWKHHEDGELIVLGGDWNKDVNSNRIRTFLDRSGLWFPFRRLHSDPHFATYQRNFKNETIDAIFCTIGLLPEACGYNDPSQGILSDHVQAWVDFLKDQLFGRNVIIGQPNID